MDTPLALPAIAWVAFAIGAAFGAAAQRSNFCTMGAVADIVLMGDWTRLRMWALAAAVAIAGTSGLQLAGLIDVHESIYTGQRLQWLGHLAGGLLFGVGMVLASGCGAKTLVRLGGGNLKSLVVFIVLGLAAYMSLRGILAGQGGQSGIGGHGRSPGSGPDSPRPCLGQAPTPVPIVQLTPVPPIPQ